MKTQNAIFKSIRMGSAPSGAGGVYFNGVDSYLSQTNNVIGNVGTTESISVWFKSSGSSIAGIGAADRDYRNFYQINDSTKTSAYQDWNDGNYHHVWVKDNIEYEDGVYTHVVINRPANRTVHVNNVTQGIMTNTLSFGSSANFSASFFEIGRLLQPSVQNDVYYESTITNLVVMDNFTTTQVNDLYQAGPDGSPMGISGINIKAWYPFKGDANDYSGNGHDFTTVNNVTFL